MPSLSHRIKDNFPSSVRLDRYVSEQIKILSRSQIKTRRLKAKINGKDVKHSHPVKKGDHLELIWDDTPPFYVVPENIPLEIIYESDRCVVINKAQGMVVHPGAGNRHGTLVNALMFYKEQRTENKEQKIINDDRFTQDTCCPRDVKRPWDACRPGIVHRLDKDTSGVIIAALDEEAHAFLSDQFKTRNVRKNYIAIVCGAPKEVKGRIETFIARDPKDRKRFTVSADGRHAVTFYKVIKQWQNHSLLLLRPKTGRTHQLRVHLRFTGCPILGDPLYGKNDKKFPDASLMLHSKTLAVTLPDEKEQRVFSASLPERFNVIIKKLNNTGGADG